MIRTIIVATILTHAVLQSAPPKYGGRLKAGMQLAYSSGGTDTPWLVVSANADSMIDGRRCLALRLRLDPANEVITSRVQCADETRMYTFSSATGHWAAARPIAAGELVIDRPEGMKFRYVAALAETDTVSGVALVVLPTTFETLDASGKVIRRLRERFSIELATATCGVFEVADGAGWRVERSFVLAAIVDGGEIPASSRAQRGGDTALTASRSSATPPKSKC